MVARATKKTPIRKRKRTEPSVSESEEEECPANEVFCPEGEEDDEVSSEEVSQEDDEQLEANTVKLPSKTKKRALERKVSVVVSNPQQETGLVFANCALQITNALSDEAMRAALETTGGRYSLMARLGTAADLFKKANTALSDSARAGSVKLHKICFACGNMIEGQVRNIPTADGKKKFCNSCGLRKIRAQKRKNAEEINSEKSGEINTAQKGRGRP